jgi:glycogen operon protein
MLIDGRAQPTGIRRPGSDVTMLIVVNAYHDLVQFTLPDCTNGKGWELVLDTNVPERDDGQRFAIGEGYDVTGNSLLLFALRS